MFYYRAKLTNNHNITDHYVYTYAKDPSCNFLVASSVSIFPK